NEYEIKEVERKIDELKRKIDERKRIKAEQEKQLIQQKEELHKNLYLLNAEGFESDTKQLKIGLDSIKNEYEIKEVERKIDELKRKIDERKRIKAEQEKQLEQEKLKQQQERIKADESEKEKSKKQDYAPFPRTFPDGLNKYYSNAEFIGEGGFAFVFKAMSNEDKRLVAIKIPKEMNEKMDDLFLREIRIWGELDHKNIVKLYKAKTYPCHYLEIEYVGGGSLENIKKPINTEKASKLINDLLEGLSEAHSKNIYHLDLKPDNILLTSDGELKITDWGLSKIAKHPTSAGVIGAVHTPMYSVPELISPKRFGKTDNRTDIFQIGTIFYELVTGVHPFDGDSFDEIMMNILEETPKKPSEINSDAKKLDALIMKCLEKKKEDRYQNVSELQKNLAEYLKIEYNKSLSESKLKGDLKRSCSYCGELLKVYASQNDIENALTYAIDLKNYAEGEYKKEMENIIEQLKYKMKEEMAIDDKLLQQINIIAHQIKMRRG
ncbi:MAG: hypothetical protein CVT88_01730, partial [Candidatus Altiarchaeales archaeon HGW-Altiarchaeales-1]